MTNEVQVANMALQKMGTRSTISDFAEDSNEARNISLIYPLVRDSLQSQAFWNFVRATRALTLLKAWPGTPENAAVPGAAVWDPLWPPPPWLYEYAYPADCLRARYVVPQIDMSSMPNPPLTSAPGVVSWSTFRGTPVRFAVASDTVLGEMQNVVLTDQQGAILVYCRRVENPDLWSPTFTQALIYNLAAELTVPLKGDRNLMADNYKLSAQFVLEAQLMDANEGLATQDPMPEWLEARGLVAAGQGYNI